MDRLRKPNTGESGERYRRATSGAAAGVVARVVSLLTVVVSIPVVLAELGSSEFGIWATLASFTALLSFADLGISNGLVNLLVRAEVDEDRDRAAEDVSSAFALLTGIAAVLAALFALAYGAVDWPAVFNAAEVNPDVVAHAAAVFVACFLALVPLGLFQRIHLGYQEGFQAYAWTAAGSLLGLAGVLAAGSADASLPWFVGATTGGPVLAALLNGALVLGRLRPWLRPRLRLVTAESVRELGRTGVSFFVIQGSLAVAVYAGPLIVAQVKGAASVEDFAVPMRLFAFLPLLLSIAMTALWPALRSAVLKGDVEWARTALRRSIWLGLATVALPTLALVPLGDPLLRLWTGDEVGASSLVLAAFGSWALLGAIVWPLWVILVAADALRAQAVMTVLMAVASVLLSIVLTASIGIAGTAIAMTVAQLVFFVLPASFYVPRLLRRLERARIPSI